MAEIRKKIKDEQIRVREEVSGKKKSTEFKSLYGRHKLNCASTQGRGVLMLYLGICFQRHKEYLKLLKERTDALGKLKAKVSRSSFY